MIRIIDNRAAGVAEPLFRSMFADRKRLFVDLFGWDVPVIDEQYEIDQFDNDHTVYVIAADTAGAHEASIRLYPTTRPHMLGALFPHLCPFGVPAGETTWETTWETTRLCLPQRQGALRRRQLRNALFSRPKPIPPLALWVLHYRSALAETDIADRCEGFAPPSRQTFERIPREWHEHAKSQWAIRLEDAASGAPHLSTPPTLKFSASRPAACCRR